MILVNNRMPLQKQNLSSLMKITIQSQTGRFITKNSRHIPRLIGNNEKKLLKRILEQGKTSSKLNPVHSPFQDGSKNFFIREFREDIHGTEFLELVHGRGLFYQITKHPPFIPDNPLKPYIYRNQFSFTYGMENSPNALSQAGFSHEIYTGTSGKFLTRSHSFELALESVNVFLNLDSRPSISHTINQLLNLIINSGLYTYEDLGYHYFLRDHDKTTHLGHVSEDIEIPKTINEFTLFSLASERTNLEEVTNLPVLEISVNKNTVKIHMRRSPFESRDFFGLPPLLLGLKNYINEWIGKDYDHLWLQESKQGF